MKIAAVLLTGLFALHAAALPAAAGPFEDAVAAHERGDYATALRLIQPLAVQGQPNAQFNLGYMYEKGQGLRQDYAQARAWYRRSAAQGMPAAQLALGNMARSGLGAAPDYAEASRWYRQAADKGNADAQYQLGILYADGPGVPQDYVQAHMWLSLAAARAAAAQPATRNGVFKARDGVAARMTPVQIAEAQKRAQEWKPRP